MPNLEAVYRLLDTCTRMTTALRGLTLHPGLTPLPPLNREYDQLVNAFTVTQAALDAWLATTRLRDRSGVDRRQTERRQGTDRREPPDPAAVA